jgi:hypothetical protein
MVRCKLILDSFHNNYGTATVLIFASGILWLDVKCYVYLFFTTGKIEISCKTYSIYFFTSCIFSAYVKALLIGDICTIIFLVPSSGETMSLVPTCTQKIHKSYEFILVFLLINKHNNITTLIFL